MTAIVTWNMQWGKGCDGTVSLERIAGVLKAMGDADVICLQEVARHEPGIAGGADQVAELEALFPGYASFYGAGVDRAGEGRKRRQFGNLLLARLPVLQVFRHLLPRPADGGTRHMPRQAIEAVVQTAAGPLRVMTTHLEYYSVGQRAAQIARLRALQEEVAANEAQPPKPAAGLFEPVPRPAACVLCGDLNLLPEDPEYAALFRPPFLDAWKIFGKGKPHPPTTGVHDRAQWPMGGHCRDYFALTPDIGARIAGLEVDLATDASDHQPLRLLLAD